MLTQFANLCSVARGMNSQEREAFLCCDPTQQRVFDIDGAKVARFLGDVRNRSVAALLERAKCFRQSGISANWAGAFGSNSRLCSVSAGAQNLCFAAWLNRLAVGDGLFTDQPQHTPLCQSDMFGAFESRPAIRSWLPSSFLVGETRNGGKIFLTGALKKFQSLLAFLFGHDFSYVCAAIVTRITYGAK